MFCLILFELFLIPGRLNYILLDTETFLLRTPLLSGALSLASFEALIRARMPSIVPARALHCAQGLQPQSKSLDKLHNIHGSQSTCCGCSKAGLAFGNPDGELQELFVRMVAPFLFFGRRSLPYNQRTYADIRSNVTLIYRMDCYMLCQAAQLYSQLQPERLGMALPGCRQLLQNLLHCWS